MENLGVLETIEGIKKTVSQNSSSKKDEVRVMQAILNDKEYKVGVFGKDGEVEKYCPSDDARSMSASIIASTTKISKDEAAKLAEEHDFSRSEAESMVGISKEFVNAYVKTGRKLPLGSREDMNVGLSLKTVEGKTRSYPKWTGATESYVDEDGTTKERKVYEHPEVTTQGYNSLRVHGSCPAHLKQN
jgi:hypothetical protein